MLRELDQADRASFVGYQTDPRYLALYDYCDGIERLSHLFDRFIEWQGERPRRNVQLGIFEALTCRLVGCGGLRRAHEQAAVLGLELAPSEWGRFRLAVDAAAALLTYGFDTLELETIFGNTASGNERIAKLARWFGAEPVTQREGPDWMKTRGWHEVDWSLSRQQWQQAKKRLSRMI